MIKIENITKNFGGLQVLKGVNLEIGRGEVVSIVGASGAGKTTLLQIIGTLDKPTGGTICFNGKDLGQMSGKALAAFRNKHIGFVFQFHQLLPEFTALENVTIPALIAGRKRKEAEAEAMELLAVMGLAERAHHKPSELSGGMRQRAALLRTYMFGGSAALLDEPFSALDTLTKGEMHRWYLDVMDKIKLSTIFITHDIDEAILLSDRICLLVGGSIADEIVIREPKPRRRDFQLTEEFLRYKKLIISKIQ